MRDNQVRPFDIKTDWRIAKKWNLLNTDLTNLVVKNQTPYSKNPSGGLVLAGHIKKADLFDGFHRHETKNSWS